jgi:hypothetical protein
MATTNLPKNKAGYGYKYTELSQINEYLESVGISYYQYIQTEDGEDYIYTVPIINNEEKTARRGCRVVNAPLSGKSNPAQEQGSAITYARRYSLLMAFGLATEDDDAESLTRPQQNAQKPQQTTQKPVDEIITAKDAETLKSLFKSKGIDEAYALKLYKLEKLEGIKKTVYTNMVKNVDKIKEKQEQEGKKNE